MKISIFGIGYVGCVSAACFAHAGHDVTGVDVNPTKVDIINSGKSPIVEPQMNELIHDVVKAGKLRATTDANGMQTLPPKSTAGPAAEPRHG